MILVAMGQRNNEGSLAGGGGGPWQRRGRVGGCLRLPLGLATEMRPWSWLPLVDSGSVAIRQLGKTSQWVRSLAILQGKMWDGGSYTASISLALWLAGMQPQRLCPNDVVKLGRRNSWVLLILAYSAEAVVDLRSNSAITACGAQRWHLALDILQTGRESETF